MSNEILELWPELDWIQDEELKSKVTKACEIALSNSILSSEDLYTIPFTTSITTKISFIAYNRASIDIAREAGIKCIQFFRDELPISLDVIVAGAILLGLGNLFRYEVVDGKYVEIENKTCTGCEIAKECGISEDVYQIIDERITNFDKFRYSSEAYIIQNSKLITVLPFKAKTK